MKKGVIMKPSIIFGLNVKKELKEQGITQTMLAKTLNTGKSTLCEWLNGNNEPPMEQLLKIATVLNVSVDYLVGLEEDSPATVSIKSPAPALSEDEKELLNIFSALSESGKDTVMVAARNAARFENKGSIHKRA